MRSWIACVFPKLQKLKTLLPKSALSSNVIIVLSMASANVDGEVAK